MLGSITRSLDDIYTRLGSRPFVSEAKLDGRRGQIHVWVGDSRPEGIADGSGKWFVDEESGRRAWVRMFSRHLEDMTEKYPDIGGTILGILARAEMSEAPLRNFVIDCVTTDRLIELDLELAKISDPVLEGKVVACRLATFRQRVISARQAKGEKKNEEYRQLLAEADKLIKQLERSPASQSEKANDLLAAAYALKVEAHAELDEWGSLVSLVDAAEGSTSRLHISVIKLVVDRATSTASTCPADAMSKILRKTLAILYSRRQVEMSLHYLAEMALWLRLIVSVLIHRNDHDQALAYVENAAHFIAQHQDDFPEDEANWMLATAWDEGLDLFAPASPIAGTSRRRSKE
ncbi:sporulation-specific protein 22 [Rhodotorula toruloides]